MAAAKLALEARFQPCPPWRGRNPLQDLAENTPELFLKVLDFTENKEIVPLHFVNLAKDIKWDVLLRNKFPQDFKSKEDIKAKFEWLHEYELKDIDAIAKMFKSKEGNNKRKRDEEEEIEFQSKALKCFYYWTKGWSKVLRGHTHFVKSVIKLNENEIVSASADNMLRVWDLRNDTSRVLRGHTDYVNSVIKLNETTIVSGSYDGTVRVWDLTNDTSRVLRGHTEWVRSVIKLNETTVVSGSDDNTLRVWDLTNNTSRELRGHTAWVSSRDKLNETTVVSASGDHTLRVWNLTNDTSRVLEGHTGTIRSVIKLNETTVVSASWIVRCECGI